MKTNLLASPDCRDKNVGVLPMIVAELELRRIQRHILFADFVERSDHAALDDGPETLNRVRVNRANGVLAPTVLCG
jgi:hypothetical protein